jgi:hypothetical protein
VLKIGVHKPLPENTAIRIIGREEYERCELVPGSAFSSTPMK